MAADLALAIAATCYAASRKRAKNRLTYPTVRRWFRRTGAPAARAETAVIVIRGWGLNASFGECDDSPARGTSPGVDLIGQGRKDPTRPPLMRGLPEIGRRDLPAASTISVLERLEWTRIESVGWCMGGALLALALAQPKLAGAVIYYGRPSGRRHIRSLAVPASRNFGALDRGSPRERSGVRAEGKRPAERGLQDLRERGHGFASSKDRGLRADDAKAPTREGRVLRRCEKGHRKT